MIDGIIQIPSSTELISFNFLLQCEPNSLLTTNAAAFQRNTTYFPTRTLGRNQLNTALDAGPGRIRIVGLAPVATDGPAEIGRIRFQVAPDAVEGETQTVTLSGQVRLVDGSVVTIEPVTAVFRVGGTEQRVFLPLVRR